MTYNITEIDNTTSLSSWFGNINTASGGLPAIVFLIILWIAVYIYSSNRNLDPGESFTATSFVSAIISTLMYFSGMFSLTPVITLIVMFFGGVIYLMFK